ncbi:hypothetical protein BC939DRAFT_457052 [Gamsiella multidivaricata]|uniref:uncharacterized protein n=1 Tax=Gamsiella multidivaricata TaxID=101098 RepID=UPI00221E59A4|nr:uncharacterized protein BC939DRAFT_457052 [Gamsiella multidivaricata]KAI7820826.1 hypothetical protein BC939DRAFT_457052 [Gamsiella multidivaricata]
MTLFKKIKSKHSLVTTHKALPCEHYPPLPTPHFRPKLFNGLQNALHSTTNQPAPCPVAYTPPGLPAASTCQIVLRAITSPQLRK